MLTRIFYELIKFHQTPNYGLHFEKQFGFPFKIFLFIDISSFVGKFHEISGLTGAAGCKNDIGFNRVVQQGKGEGYTSDLIPGDEMIVRLIQIVLKHIFQNFNIFLRIVNKMIRGLDQGVTAGGGIDPDIKA